MRLLHALLAVSLVSLVACGEPSAREDAGVPDAGVPDAGVPDAGEPDAGVPDAGPQPQACDAGPGPAGVPQLTGRFVITDAGVAPFVSGGDTLVGTWGAVSAEVYLADAGLAAFVDPSQSYIDGGTQWFSLRADGGYATAIDAALTLGLRFFPNGPLTVYTVPFESASYGAAQVVPGGELTLVPACGEAPQLARFANPSTDGGTQLLLRVALDAGVGAQNADIVFELVPLQE